MPNELLLENPELAKKWVKEGGGYRNTWTGEFLTAGQFMARFGNISSNISNGSSGLYEKGQGQDLEYGSSGLYEKQGQDFKPVTRQEEEEEGRVASEVEVPNSGVLRIIQGLAQVGGAISGSRDVRKANQAAAASGARSNLINTLRGSYVAQGQSPQASPSMATSILGSLADITGGVREDRQSRFEQERLLESDRRASEKLGIDKYKAETDREDKTSKAAAVRKAAGKVTPKTAENIWTNVGLTAAEKGVSIEDLMLGIGDGKYMSPSNIKMWKQASANERDGYRAYVGQGHRSYEPDKLNPDIYQEHFEEAGRNGQHFLFALGDLGIGGEEELGKGVIAQFAAWYKGGERGTAEDSVKAKNKANERYLKGIPGVAIKGTGNFTEDMRSTPAGEEALKAFEQDYALYFLAEGAYRYHYYKNLPKKKDTTQWALVQLAGLEALEGKLGVLGAMHRAASKEGMTGPWLGTIYREFFTEAMQKWGFPLATTFESFHGGIALTVAVALQGSRPSDAETTAVRMMVPNLTDTAQIRELKLAGMRALSKARERAIRKNFNIPLTEFVSEDGTFDSEGARKAIDGGYLTDKMIDSLIREVVGDEHKTLTDGRLEEIEVMLIDVAATKPDVQAVLRRIDELKFKPTSQDEDEDGGGDEEVGATYAPHPTDNIQEENTQEENGAY